MSFSFSFFPFLSKKEGGKDDVRELDQTQAHLFLEKRGETMTATALRDGKLTYPPKREI